MDVTIYGARGSYPVSSAQHMYYGGNTPCIDIRLNNGHHVVFDMGTGSYNLGQVLEKEFSQNEDNHISIIISHPHWDHILGFPHFKPFHMSNVRADIYSPVYGYETVEKIFMSQQSEVHFPVQLSKMKAKLNFHEVIPSQDIEFKDCQVSVVQLNHPGKTVGYRLTHGSKVISTMVDTGSIENNLLGVGMLVQYDAISNDYYDRYHQAIHNHTKDADLLIHDSFFSSEDIKGKEHWGHCSFEMAVNQALQAKAKNLLLFHHNPNYSDVQIDEYTKAMVKKYNHATTIWVAREGLSIHL